MVLDALRASDTLPDPECCHGRAQIMDTRCAYIHQCGVAIYGGAAQGIPHHEGLIVCGGEGENPRLAG